MEQGQVHLYFGDGKGKTTAAAGLALRACGRGLSVLWTSFLKDFKSGELVCCPFGVLEGVPVDGFYTDMPPARRNKIKTEHTARLDAAFRRAQDEMIDLLILDEALYALSFGIFTEQELLSRLYARPDSLEVVLTGGEAPESLVTVCDYASEIKKIKHPFDAGLSARRGIED